MIETFPQSAVNITNHGIQIPGIQYSESSVQLSLTVDSDLVVNQQYTATITTINEDGARGHNVTIEFGLYFTLSQNIISFSYNIILNFVQIHTTFNQ